MTSVAGKDVYIVDYSDLNQAPDDFKDCTLKGIVDHHKLGDMTSSAPLEIVIMPVAARIRSSSACMTTSLCAAEEYRRRHALCDSLGYGDLQVPDLHPGRQGCRG